jgi:hypothetical protein
MIGRFPFSVYVADDGAILLDRLFERGQVPTDTRIDCLRAEPPKCLATERGILKLSRLHAVVARDECVYRILPILPRSRVARDNQGERRIASSRNAPERAGHCLIRMLPSPRHIVNRTQSALFEQG